MENIINDNYLKGLMLALEFVIRWSADRSYIYAKEHFTYHLKNINISFQINIEILRLEDFIIEYN